MASTAARINGALSSLKRSPTKKPPICAGVRLPAKIASKTRRTVAGEIPAGLVSSEKMAGKGSASFVITP
jgi:hypothetical protein